ncbi:MAG: flavodoxin [Acholeplasmataceae bacterium]|nr:flavodoxin [Acholeplasmataceae bacterium]
MEKVLVVYWTGTGNTEMMAEKIAEGLVLEGLDVTLRQVDEIDVDEALTYEKIAFGCPSMGLEILEEDEFEPFFEEIENQLDSRKIALFGSYGWGDGEWMDAWIERVQDLNLNLFEPGLKINSTPSPEEEEDCLQFGREFAKY